MILLSLSLSLYPFHLSLSLSLSYLSLSLYISPNTFLSLSLFLLSIILFGVSNGRFRPCFLQFVHNLYVQGFNMSQKMARKYNLFMSMTWKLPFSTSIAIFGDSVISFKKSSSFNQPWEKTGCSKRGGVLMGWPKGGINTNSSA